MGKADNVSNIQHWNSLLDKARRSGWKDSWEWFSPVGYGIRSVDRKDWYVRVMNPTFLCALFGDEPANAVGITWEARHIPRYHLVGLQVADRMMSQDPESVLAWLDSLPVYNWRDDPETGPDPVQEEAHGADTEGTGSR